MPFGQEPTFDAQRVQTALVNSILYTRCARQPTFLEVCTPCHAYHGFFLHDSLRRVCYIGTPLSLCRGSALAPAGPPNAFAAVPQAWAAAAP